MTLTLTGSTVERMCSEGTCITGSVAPPSSQPARARSHFTSVLPEVCARSSVVLSSSLKYFSQMGWGVRRSGLCTSFVLCFSCASSSVRINFWLMLMPVSISLGTDSTDSARPSQEDLRTQTTHPALARPLGHHVEMAAQESSDP